MRVRDLRPIERQRRVRLSVVTVFMSHPPIGPVAVLERYARLLAARLVELEARVRAGDETAWAERGACPRCGEVGDYYGQEASA